MKKYQICIHKTGSESNFLTTMIGHHNSGRSLFNLIDIVGYLKCQKAAFPSAADGYTYVWDSANPNGSTLHVSEDGGKSFTLSITQIQVLELNNVNV